MDIKITSARFKNFLSYDWGKIIISIIAGIVVWSLLFTTLGTRITVGEQFYFVVYENVFTSGSVDKNNRILDDLKEKNVFSYDVLQCSVSNISSAGQYSASYMLSLRATTQEGDVFLISDGRAVTVDENGKDKNGKDPTQEMSSAITNNYFFNFETFLEKARIYCEDSGFVIDDPDTPMIEVSEEKIRKYFLTVRIPSAKNYKRTYRTPEQKNEGVKNEIERIKAVYSNYLYVSNALARAKEDGNDFLWYGAKDKYNDQGEVDGKEEPQPYGIDLYKLNAPFIDSKPKIEDTWYTYANEKTTAEGLVMCVFNFESYQKDLQYESLAFIRYIIETYSGY